jgi:hypothetical protein
VDWVLDLLYIYIYNESGSGSRPFCDQKFMAWNKKRNISCHGNFSAAFSSGGEATRFVFVTFSLVFARLPLLDGIVRQVFKGHHLRCPRRQTAISSVS